MGRKRTRTENLHLPERLGRDGRSQVLRYRRPDNGRHLYLTGVREDLAIDLAIRLNIAFGTQPPRGMRGMYRSQFLAYRWKDEPREIIDLAAAKLPDIMPMQRGVGKQEEIRHSWAYDPPRPEALRRGLKPLLRSKAWIAPLFASTRKNATKRGIAFELTLADLEELVAESNGRCVVTGIILSTDHGELARGRRMRRPWAPSIDRIDSAAGYSRGNCRLVCCAANLAMSQWGEAVLVEMAKAIARKRITRMARVVVG